MKQPMNPADNQNAPTAVALQRLVRPPCDCGSPNGEWHDTDEGSRTYMCSRCWDITKSVLWIQAAVAAVETKQIGTAKQYLWHAHQKLADALEKPEWPNDKLSDREL